MNPTTTAAVNIIVTVTGASAANTQFNAAMNSLVNSSQNAANKVKGFWADAFSSLVGNIAANFVSRLTGIIAQIPAEIGKAVDTAQTYERIRISLDVLNGSADKTNQKLAELREIAKKTAGVDFRNLSEGQRNLQAVGFEADNATKLLTKLGAVRILSGGTKEDYKAVLYNLSQIRANGKLTGDELRESVMRLPFLARVIQQEFGTLNSEVINKLSRNSDGFFKRLLNQLEQVPQVSGGATLAFEQLNEATDRFYAATGNLVLQNPSVVAALQVITREIDTQAAGYENLESRQARALTSIINFFAKGALEAYNFGKALNTSFIEIGKIVGIVAITITNAFESAFSFMEDGLRKISEYANFVLDQVKSIPQSFFGTSQVGLAAYATIQGAQGVPLTPKTFRSTDEIRQSQDTAVSLFKQDIFKDMGRTRQEILANRRDFERLLKENAELLKNQRNFVGSGYGAFSPKGRGADEEGGASGRRGKAFQVNSQGRALQQAANILGVNAVDLGAIIGFETGGTFSPNKVGGAGNNYRGLIQFGAPERRQFNVRPGQTFEQQLLESVVPYFQARFAKVGRETQGASLLDLYTTVIAGNPNANIHRKDAFGTSALSGARRIFQEFRPLVARRFFGDNDTISGQDFGSELRRSQQDNDKRLQEQSRILTEGEIARKLNQQLTAARITGIPLAESAAAELAKRRNQQLEARGEAQIATPEYIQQLVNDSQGTRIRAPFINAGQLIPNAPITDDAQGVRGIEALTKQLSLEEQYVVAVKDRLGIEANVNDLYFLRQPVIQQELAIQTAIQKSQQLELDLINEQATAQADRINNADAQFVANRRALAVQRESNDLAAERNRLEDELINFDINSRDRIQNALLADRVQLRRQEEDAIIATSRAQSELANQTVYSAERANSKVLEFLASQNSVTDAVADFKIGVVTTTYDFIDKGLDRITKKLGAIGDVIKDLLGSFIRMGLNRVFQRLFGLEQSGGAGTAVATGARGGGFLSSIGNFLFGGNRGGAAASTPPFNPNAGGAPSVLSGGVPAFGTTLGGQSFNFMTGGFNNTGATATVRAGQTLTQAAASQQQLAAAIQQAGTTGGATGGATAAAGNAASAATGAGGFRAALGGLAPVLGGALGGQLGAGSNVGTIAGSAGGIIGGTLLGGLITTGSIGGATTGGIFGSTAGLFGLSGAATFGIGAAIAGGLLLASYLFGRSARRRREQQQVATLTSDAKTQIKAIIDNYRMNWRRTDGASVLAQVTQIRNQFEQQGKQLRTSPAKRAFESNLREIDAMIRTLGGEVSGRERQKEVAAATQNAVVNTFDKGGFTGFGYGSRTYVAHAPEVILRTQDISALGGYDALKRAGVRGVEVAGSSSVPSYGVSRGGSSMYSGDGSGGGVNVYPILVADDETADIMFQKVKPFGVAKKVKIAALTGNDAGVVDTFERRMAGDLS